MNTLDRNWDLFCSKLKQVKPTRNGIEALCPAHDDKNPSLTAFYNNEGIFVYCFTECTFKEIVTAMGMEESQFFAQEEKILPKTVEAVYRYEDKDGGHVFNVIRYSDKTFSQQTADGQWSMDGVERIPYRLTQMLAGIKDGKDILILEGEKDCDNAEKIGLVATTFAGGAGKWREEYSKWFQEAKVICLPDNDPPGRNGMHLIASKIEKVAESVRWLELPDVPEKGDLSDWLSIEGNDLNKIQELISNAKQWNKKINKDSLVVLTLDELLNKKIPPRQNLLTPWLPSQGLCMIYSKRGLGKTWMALEIAYAIASGGRFLNWEAEYSQGVLYIDGEMPLSLMQERLSQIENSRGKKIGGLLKILSPDAQEFGIPDLSTREGQEKIDELMGDEIRLVVLDNLSTLIRSGKESESDSWLPVQEWVLRLRSKGKSVLLIHHAGKGGQQRGTSRREDVLDTVIALRKPENYSPDSGTCFEVHFEKNRGLYGDNIKPFEAHLETHLRNDGVETINWECKSLEDSTYEKVCRLSCDGLSNTDITQELAINKSTVSRHVKRGKQEGKINLRNN
jgi:hypothetical protein